MKSHSGFGVDISNGVCSFFVTFVNVQTYARHVYLLHSHSLPIIIMFKEVKIQYTINLTLFRTSLFFSECDGLFNSPRHREEEGKGEQRNIWPFVIRRASGWTLIVDYLWWIFPIIYDCYCYCDCRALHIRRLRFCFDLFSISLLVISNVLRWCCIEWERTHTTTADGTQVRRWIMKPFFSPGCRIYRRVSKSQHWCVKADSSSESHKSSSINFRYFVSLAAPVRKKMTRKSPTVDIDSRMRFHHSGMGTLQNKTHTLVWVQL